jgi:thioredoxin 1
MKTKIIFLLLFTASLIAPNALKAQTDDSRVTILTADDFHSSIKKGVILVDFYADWCRPCKMQGPILEEIAFENSNMKIAKLNVDYAKDISAEYGIRGIPCLIIYKDGVEMERLVGLQSKEDIVATVKKHL